MSTSVRQPLFVASKFLLIIVLTIMICMYAVQYDGTYVLRYVKLIFFQGQFYVPFFIIYILSLLKLKDCDL